MIVLKSRLERFSLTRFARARCLITSVQIGRHSFTATKMIKLPNSPTKKMFCIHFRLFSSTRVCQTVVRHPKTLPLQ